jgi:hypothetical protein
MIANWESSGNGFGQNGEERDFSEEPRKKKQILILAT